MLKRLLLLAVLLGLIAGGVPAYLFWFGPGPAGETKTITVEQGSSLGRVAAQLERAGVIRSSSAFRYAARLLGSSDPVQAGEFEIAPALSGAQVLDHLQNGQPVQRLVTIPEGMPSVLVHERLMQNPYLTGAVDVPEEGSVLPDSYSFGRGETRAAVLGRMQSAMERTLAALWRERQPHSVVNSPREAIILASIVEKETGKPSERRAVAGVYSNRVRIGMKLDADPTVIYPVTRGRPLGRRIRRSELQADNGYNTYARAGLPAGPIANPGRESIAAVMNPEQHQYVYFVADGTGGHIFARTLAEHNANVQRWYALRRAKGEM